jgi:predicted glycoside hydrolase/deacetylase ChbG (UPF0249 family)
VSERLLIVNADDFGRSPGVNSGIIRAHEEGIVTSATLMVRWPDADEAAVYARGASLAVGLHLDLGEWEYSQGEWHAGYEVVDTESADAVAEELERQLGRFEQLMGRPPSHLDSHQHVHRDEPVRSELLRVGELLGVPVRQLTPGIEYSGAFFGHDGRETSLPHATTDEALVRVIEDLAPGVTELACHPAAEVDHESSYAHERLMEVETLCDPRVRAAIERGGVTLRSFADLPAYRGPA